MAVEGEVLTKVSLVLTVLVPHPLTWSARVYIDGVCGADELQVLRGGGPERP